MRGDDVKGEADLRKELSAAWRGGCEDEPHQARASTVRVVSITCASRGCSFSASSATLADSMQSIWRQPSLDMSARPLFAHGFQTTVVLEFPLVTVIRRCRTGSSTTMGDVVLRYGRSVGPVSVRTGSVWVLRAKLSVLSRYSVSKRPWTRACSTSSTCR